MKKVSLLMGIHNHQPVGNFDHVFREAHDRCYRPFLDLLWQHPTFRLSLHYSGPLLDWFEEHEPSFLDQLGRLVKRDQVELLTGGYYEPILAIIPERDAIGQIRMMTRHLRERLGVDSKGLWLAERVWEPSLPSLLSASGVTYTILDDTHFQLAGMKPDELRGYYLTERGGATLSIFPISKRLRYLIPFRPPEEIIGYLEQLAGSSQAEGPVAVTYADDGEKFGLWPGTYRWVYDQKWLANFMSLLEKNRDWITLTTFSEYLAQAQATGRVYLPAASYEEMMEWALPTEVVLEREDLLMRLGSAGLAEAAGGFLGGGFFSHFLVKYPGINLMHKKMLYVSEKLYLKENVQPYKKMGRIIAPKWVGEARRELYQAQGNDAYWHGLFGGYYLNYLRHAVHQHLLKAEQLTDFGPAESSIRLTETDLDRDGRKEWLAETPGMNLYLKPDDGATALEMDYRPKSLCFTHVPMRRPEAYHQKLKTVQASQTKEGIGIPSIHEIVAVKEPGLDRKLVYDRHPRWSFRDHLIQSETTLDQFESVRQEELGGFCDQPYETESARANSKGVILQFRRKARVGGSSLDVAKIYTLSPSRARLTVAYAFHTSQLGETQGSAHARAHSRAPLHSYYWCVELNLTLLAGADPKRYYRFPGKVVENVLLGSRGELTEVKEAYLVDEWQGIEIRLELEPAARCWRFPIETVSQSEEGMESTYQGSCLVAVWPLTLPLSGKQEARIAVEIAER
jgi:alpha-amylase